MIKSKKKSYFSVVISIFLVNMSIKLYLSITNSLWQDDSWVALGIFANKFSDFQLSSGHPQKVMFGALGQHGNAMGHRWGEGLCRAFMGRIATHLNRAGGRQAE